ncbi:MAG: hypothetical protein JWQ35_2499 [Bacteriovoracaceae bacterium]|nr:hypothetical protein [Bacteriovoracaceae bacterium]
MMDSLQIQSPENPQKAYRIGELAKLTNSTTRTLRFYEEMNLLQPIRNLSGQRLYSEASISKLNFINELKSGGFSLQEIKTFFDSWHHNETGEKAASDTIKIVQKKLLEIAELQRKIGKLNDDLKGMVSYLLSCKGCDHKPSLNSCSNCDQHSHEKPDPVLLSILKQD